jgi:hypothetical protein
MLHVANRYIITAYLHTYLLEYEYHTVQKMGNPSRGMLSEIDQGVGADLHHGISSFENLRGSFI